MRGRGPAQVPYHLRFLEKVGPEGDNGCRLWTGMVNPRGYGLIYTSGSGRRKRLFAHRVSWELANGEIPGDLCVLHRCDNPPCVNPAHLFLGTQADNMRDMDEKGRRRVADHNRTGNPNAKLTEQDVINIRSLRANGATTVSLSSAFGITTGHVSRICLKQNWAREKGPLTE